MPTRVHSDVAPQEPSFGLGVDLLVTFGRKTSKLARSLADDRILRASLSLLDGEEERESSDFRRVIKESLRVGESTVSYHYARLADAEIITRSEDGRVTLQRDAKTFLQNLSRMMSEGPYQSAPLERQVGLVSDLLWAIASHARALMLWYLSDGPQLFGGLYVATDRLLQLATLSYNSFKTSTFSEHLDTLVSRRFVGFDEDKRAYSLTKTGKLAMLIFENVTAELAAGMEGGGGIMDRPVDVSHDIDDIPRLVMDEPNGKLTLEGDVSHSRGDYLVCDDVNRVIGTVGTETAPLLVRAWVEDPKTGAELLRKIVVKVNPITTKTTVGEALRIAFLRRVAMLPVLQEGKVEGVWSADRVTQELLSYMAAKKVTRVTQS